MACKSNLIFGLNEDRGRIEDEDDKGPDEDAKDVP